MGPEKPSRTTTGRRPQWSRWAWVTRMASHSVGSKPSGTRFRITSLGLPWNIPQSIRTRARSVVSRKREPVTVLAPPRKRSSTLRSDRRPGGHRPSLDADDGVERHGDVERAHPSDDPEDDGEGDEEDRVQPDLAARLGNAAHDGKHRHAGCRVVRADPERERPEMRRCPVEDDEE